MEFTTSFLTILLIITGIMLTLINLSLTFINLWTSKNMVEEASFQDMISQKKFKDLR